LHEKQNSHSTETSQPERQANLTSGDYEPIIENVQEEEEEEGALDTNLEAL